MKKFFCLLLGIALLAGMLTGTMAVSGAEELPSLFHNDEAWYKDGAAPLVLREDVYYVPAELFDLMENVSVTSPTPNNLLISNDRDEYISILFTEGRAAVNGEIAENVRIFRDGSILYVDVLQVADAIGISVEPIIGEDGRISMRLTDGSQSLTAEELLASYLPEESVTDEFAVTEEEDHWNLNRIFILCREPDPEVEEKYRALDLLQKYGMGYTLFLSADTSTEFLLYALAGGEYGILTDTDGEDAVTELNALNQRFGRITRYRTHFTMSTGNVSEDEKLIRAAYCPVIPDFIVDSSVDADTMFADMLEYLGRSAYCFLMLEDCKETARMLELLSYIDREKFITSNLGH